MNYLLLAAAITVTFMALLLISTIVRVMAGKASFNGALAAIFHVALTAGLVVFAMWLFQIGVAK